jgi:hypothetical protein
MWTGHARGPGWIGLFLAGALVAGGCAASPRTEVPAELPNSTREQFLTLRWALLRDGGKVRAVGIAEPSTSGSPWEAIVALEGLDSSGRIVSEDSTAIRPGFSGGSTAFEVELVPKGGEAQFRLRIVRAQQFPRAPGK